MSETGGRISLKRKIYLDLKQRLIQCVYPPGSELNELLLTAEYGVSRTPIREAVSQLELEGYLKVLPKKGIYIPDVSIDKVLQIFQTRLEVQEIPGAGAGSPEGPAAGYRDAPLSHRPVRK